MKKKGYLEPWVFGVVAGAVFVSFEAFLGFYPPAAYSFCLSCHTRDLVNGVLNALFQRGFQTAAIARRALLVTSPAVMTGAFIAAKLHGERLRIRVKRHPLPGERRLPGLERPFLHFISGFLVMVAGIVVFGCPTRITIRAAYGDLYGLVTLAGMFIGIWCGTLVISALSRRAS